LNHEYELAKKKMIKYFENIYELSLLDKIKAALPEFLKKAQ